MGGTLKVYLTGKVAVETDGLELPDGRFPGRQGRLLFAYLITEQGRPIPRDELADVLWGESLPATWDKALTVLVSKLRVLLAEAGVDAGQALTSAFGCYRLDLPPQTWVDVLAAAGAARDAEQALTDGDLDRAQTAASLTEATTRSPFLPGDNGMWVESKRRELAQLRWRAVRSLAEIHLERGEPGKAVTWATEATAIEPFRETGHRLLMQAHASAGNRAEALRAYDRCRRLLDDELGTDPSPETAAIYRRLLESPTEPAVLNAGSRKEPDTRSDLGTTSTPSQLGRIGRRRSRVNLLAVGAAALVVVVVAAFVIWRERSDRSGAGPATRSGAAGIQIGAGSHGTVKIGFEGPLSGDLAQIGSAEHNAFTLAIQQANASDKLGFTIEGVAADDVGDGGHAPTAAEALITDASIVGVIGPATSTATRAVADTYASAGLALISPSATDPTLTHAGFATFHRIVPPDDLEAKATAGWLARKVTNVFVLDDTSEFATYISNAVEQELRSRHVTVEHQAITGISDTTAGNVAQLATAVVAARAQAVYFAGGDAEAAAFTKALTAAHFEGIRIATGTAMSPQFTRGADTAGEGFYFVCGCQDVNTVSAASAFASAYDHTYGLAPSLYAPEAFDATNALVQAIKMVAAKGFVTRAKVEAALRTLDYRGITGEIKFTPSGESADPMVNLFAQRGGRIVELGDITSQ